ncbi:MAG: fibronectin type III domain-containing protein, partial [Acidobacteria bacterium]|nr:fibronectin type III domain-containing protein [Acidobacteriota bacterium]
MAPIKEPGAEVPAGLELPAAPEGLTVAPGDRSLEVSWAPAAVEQAVSAYSVQWSLDGGQWTELPKSSEPRAKVEGLTNGVLVFVQVAAENAAGRGATVATSGIPSAPASAPRSPGRVSTPASGDPYGDVVRADSPSAYWPLTDQPGSAVSVDALGGPALSGAIAHGMPAPIGGTGAAFLNRSPLTGARDVSVPGAVEAWVNVGSVNGDYAVVASVGDRSNGWEVRIDPMGAVSAVSFNNDAQTEVGSSAGVVMPGAWYHLAVSTDGTTATIVVNGESVATGVAALVGGAIRFGADVSGENSLYGSIAHVAVYPMNVPASRLAAHFAASGYRPGTGNLPTARAGDTYAVINWSSPTDTGGARIIGYRVEMRERGGDWTIVVDNSYSTTTAAFVSDLPGGGKLVNGRTYEFRVRAMTQVGAGSPSDVVSVVPVGIATSPQNVNFTSTGNGRIEATWSAPANDGGTPVIAYRIEVADDGATWWTLATASAD